jgi:hypothetical protein
MNHIHIYITYALTASDKMTYIIAPPNFLRGTHEFHFAITETVEHVMCLMIIKGVLPTWRAWISKGHRWITFVTFRISVFILLGPLFARDNQLSVKQSPR